MRRIRRQGWLLLGAALLLRAAIPAGYMPASGDSALLFELCPEGVPAAFLQFTAGTSGEHQHHAGHGADKHHCPIGHLLLSAFAIDDHGEVTKIPAVPVFAPVPGYSYRTTFRPVFFSRGPPA